MRILIIVENLPVPFDRRVWLEATTLVAAGHQVCVISPTGPGYEARYEVIDGIHVYRHPLPVEADGPAGYVVEYSAALFWETLLAWRVFFRHGIDVIHACNPPDTIFLVAAPFKLLGRKFIFDHHDVNPELFESKFGRRGLLYRLVRGLERATFACANLSIATNESYRRIAIERGKMAPDRVYVVRSGPDVARMRAVEPDPAWRQGRRFLVGYVGVMGVQEGLDLLLDAVRWLVHEARRDDVHFVLVGGGTELDKLRDMAASLGVADHVTFTGRVSDAVLLSALNSADVCVNPDRVNPLNNISTMNKIMEYMALGKPIVQFESIEGRYSAQGASLYAAANDGVDLARKLLELLDDPARRASMGELGRRRVVEELGWEHQGPRLLAAYDRLQSI